MSTPLISSRVKKRIEVLALLKAGISPTVISKKLNIARRSIYYISKRISYQYKKRIRQPKKLTPTTREKIEKEFRDVPFASIRKCAKILNFSDNYIERQKTISRTSLQHFLKTTEWGKTAYKIRKEPMMSVKNIDDRKRFAQIVSNSGYISNTRRSKELRRHVLWTDESSILLNPEPNTQNMRIRTSDKAKIPTIKVPKKSIKIMVAGGICARGVT